MFCVCWETDNEYYDSENSFTFFKIFIFLFIILSFSC